jgi:iron-sulfur cluster repair protein YtfE (RIC family)
MKRHPDLRTFSDDHHQGLVQARRLRRAAAGEEAEPADAARGFLEFWRRETSLHFRKEEEVLLPVLARHGGDLSRRSVVEMLVQHARIRASPCSLATSSSGMEFSETRCRAWVRS